MEKGVILCVDDERVVLNGLQSQLGRGFGDEYPIEVTESAEEALELVKEILESGIDIPIVISDQLMPGMKGHELLKLVHELSPATYTILLTGQSDLEAVTEAVNHANLYRYISKPWEGHDLLLTVREAIKSYYQDQQLEEQNRMLDIQNKELEEIVEERTQELLEEKRKSDELLLNILPEEIAAELKEKGEATARHYDMVTILFTDFQQFTKLASEVSPAELIFMLNECYSAFDDIVDRHGMEKIKTIGDSYMCAGGLPVENRTNAVDAVDAAREIQQWIADWNMKRELNGQPKLDIRIGIHTGKLIAGVIGKKKFAYDVWGDAVNIASRMEQNSETGKINISEATYELVKHRFTCNYRGEILAKNKGVLKMYYVR